MIQTVSLGSGQAPPPNENCVVVVKTADQDFEVVTCLTRTGAIATLGSSPSLDAAIEIARKGAADLKLSVIYTVGECSNTA